MLPRAARLFVALATMIAAWAIATPARAAAPLCDPRGATTFAPAPQLQAPETSIDVGMVQDDCLARLAAMTTVEDGRAPQPAPPSLSGDPAVPSAMARVHVVASRPLSESYEAIAGARSGMRSRVDRPPRA